ncbi:uncharacterized protein EI90DRAFT_93524 [Cantharellus anzutake]|uniref:uncharacterized protein n=1 Tax=Cantharellus anzutake TaxID=1750568 RepID=UPI00190694C1|nr:uncharacterized protein EI90DRAFT_93524 [Cantharellus anzutake]KAF8336963.1 hypothetical protein EI90DRAFT_93524 [Cantharellus anzutake]
MASDLRPEYSLDSLSALGGVEIATSALRERSFSEAKFGSEIRQLCHAPENLVVIFSNDSDLLSNLNNFLVRQYPVDGSPLMKSLSHQVLEALGKFFCGVSPPRELDGQEFKDHVAKASQITQVLRALAGMKFDKSTEEFPKSHGARTKKGKRPKRVSISGSVMSIEVNAVDSEAFKALGLVTPSSEVEASDLLKGLMDVHREILFVRVAQST